MIFKPVRIISSPRRNLPAVELHELRIIMRISLKIEEEKINRGFVDIQKASNIAAKNTLNIVAAISRKNYIANVKRNMILRNTFTVRQIRFTKTETENISLMESRVGATEKASYLKLHEESGRRKSKRGSALAIPQNYVRGGSRRRVVSRRHYLRKIKKIKGKFKINFKSKRARNVARAYVAYREKKIMKYSDNLYTVFSFRKSKTKIKFKKHHLYNVSQRTAYIKQTQMLAPAIEQPVRDSQNIYNSQMRKLLRSRKII